MSCNTYRPFETVEDMLFQLPVPTRLEDGTAIAYNESYWERAYHDLFARYAQGPSAAFTYVEPVSYDEILKNVPALPKLGNIVRGEVYRSRADDAQDVV